MCCDAEYRVMIEGGPAYRQVVDVDFTIVSLACVFVLLFLDQTRGLAASEPRRRRQNSLTRSGIYPRSPGCSCIVPGHRFHPQCLSSFPLPLLANARTLG